jgi:DTW domain-containing protein YfiP
MSRARCDRCLRPTDRCLCPLIPKLGSQTRVLILQHPSEVNHALNTARLAALGLENAELRVGEVFEDLAQCLNPPGYQADEQPVLLVVPDGTWRKARKLLHLNPLLAQLPRVFLENAPPSRYRLRKAPGPDALSTLEAIVHALHTLEPGRSFDALLRPFDALIEGQIAAMGMETFSRNHS